MGQGGSATGSGVATGPGTRRSLRFSRRSRAQASVLSHAFSVATPERAPELLDVNVASEEQLMTLPGISRGTARAIVDHRRRIGRFKRLDDLALVSGIGAEKLEAMRGEICTSKRGISRASSCTQSLDSTSTVRTFSDSPKLISVNSASVFQLQCVPGLNQELAANIVSHREKKGPFKSLDNLIKVRGIDMIRLGSIKQHLNIETSKPDDMAYLLTNGNLKNGAVVNNNSLNSISDLPRTPSHRKSSSMPIKYPMTLNNGFATAPVNDIFDLLSAYSHRPIIEEDFNYERDGVKCCRLASWNLHNLNVDKVNNPGVREVVCRTILENKISLLAIQDILEEAALRTLRDELNSPVLRRVREWKSNSRQWEYSLSKDERSKNLGFLYNTTYKGITIEAVSLEESSLDIDSGSRDTLADALASLRGSGGNCRASSQLFMVCGRRLMLVNVLARGELSQEECGELQRVVEAAQAAGVAVCLVGEFHSAHNIHKFKTKCISLIGEDVHTTLELNGPGRGDILSIGKDSSAGGFNGAWGVVRGGLSHLAIPQGWSWGGAASPHCPLWAEYTLPD